MGARQWDINSRRLMDGCRVNGGPSPTRWGAWQPVAQRTRIDEPGANTHTCMRSPSWSLAWPALFSMFPLTPARDSGEGESTRCRLRIDSARAPVSGLGSHVRTQDMELPVSFRAYNGTRNTEHVTARRHGQLWRGLVMIINTPSANQGRSTATA